MYYLYPHNWGIIYTITLNNCHQETGTGPTAAKTMNTIIISLNKHHLNANRSQGHVQQYRKIFYTFVTLTLNKTQLFVHLLEYPTAKPSPIWKYTILQTNCTTIHIPFRITSVRITVEIRWHVFKRFRTVPLQN